MTFNREDNLQYFVRVGERLDDGRFATDDADLTRFGAAQVKAAGRFLTENGAFVGAKLVRAPGVRSIATANLLQVRAEFLPRVEEEGLSGRELGPLKGQEKALYRTFDFDAMEDEGVETSEKFAKRVWEAHERLTKVGGDLIVVTYGSTLSMLGTLHESQGDPKRYAEHRGMLPGAVASYDPRTGVFDMDLCPDPVEYLFPPEERQPAELAEAV